MAHNPNQPFNVLFLCMRSLDTLSLQQQLDAIGKTKDTQTPHTSAAE